MKRLLLIPALAWPLALLSCGKTPELPKVPGVSSANEVVRTIPLDDFNHFPTPTPTPAPVEAPKKHVVKHKPAAKHTVKRPVYKAAPQPDPQPAPIPPQQGPICIFPFNLIPNCTPGVP